MLKNSLIVLFTLIVMFAKGEDVIVYKTYDDYKNKKGIVYDELKTYGNTGRFTMKVAKDGTKVKYSWKDFWGFSYKNKLFRSTSISGIVMLVMDGKKILYYENGLAHLAMLYSDSSSGGASGSVCFFSKTIISEIYLIPTPFVMTAGSKKKAYKDFKSKNLEYSSLFKCIEEKSSPSEFTTQVYNCFKSFEGITK